jgi:hypothetical protein
LEGVISSEVATKSKEGYPSGEPRHPRNVKLPITSRLVGSAMSVGDTAEEVESGIDGVRESVCSVDWVDWISAIEVVSGRLDWDVSPDVVVLIGKTVVETSELVYVVSVVGIACCSVKVLEVLSCVAVVEVEISIADDWSEVCMEDEAMSVVSDNVVVTSKSVVADVSVFAVVVESTAEITVELWSDVRVVVSVGSVSDIAVLVSWLSDAVVVSVAVNNVSVVETSAVVVVNSSVVVVVSSTGTPNNTVPDSVPIALVVLVNDVDPVVVVVET